MRRCISQQTTDVASAFSRFTTSKSVFHKQHAAFPCRRIHIQNPSYLKASDRLEATTSAPGEGSEQSQAQDVSGPTTSSSDQSYQTLGQDESVQSTSSSKEEEVESRSTSRPRRPLPLSPLMNPSFHAAKSKYQKPKTPRPRSVDQTPFQRELYNNPYAQMLATPLRRDPVTKTSLPRYFLQDFELMSQPGTGVPWYLPRDLALAKVELPKESQKGQKEEEKEEKVEAETSQYDDTHTSTPDSAVNVTVDPVPDAQLTPSESPAVNETKPTLPPNKRGPRFYLISSELLLSHIGKAPYRKARWKFHREDLRAYVAFKPDTFQWRKDMGTFVLELTRRRVSERLALLAHHQNTSRRGRLDMLSPVAGFEKDGNPTDGGVEAVRARLQEELQSGVMDTSAVLWLGHSRSNPHADAESAGTPSHHVADTFSNSAESNPTQTAESQAEPEPGEFSTLDLGFAPSKIQDTEAEAAIRHNIPVFNLPVLLGDTHLQKLQAQFPTTFGTPSTPTPTTFSYLLLRKGRRPSPNYAQERNRSLDALSWLWKLQGYLARYGYEPKKRGGKEEEEQEEDEDEGEDGEEDGEDGRHELKKSPFWRSTLTKPGSSARTFRVRKVALPLSGEED